MEAGGSAWTSLAVEALRGPSPMGPQDRDIYLQELSGPNSKYLRRTSCASGMGSGKLLSGDAPGDSCPRGTRVGESSDCWEPVLASLSPGKDVRPGWPQTSTGEKGNAQVQPAPPVLFH